MKTTIEDQIRAIRQAIGASIQNRMHLTTQGKTESERETILNDILRQQQALEDAIQTIAQAQGFREHLKLFLDN